MNQAQAIFENLPVAWIVIGFGFVAGFFVARKFPGLFPMQLSNNDIASRLDAIESKLKS